MSHNPPDPKAIKLANAKRLCTLMGKALANGTARPTSADAKPILMEMRVSDNAVGRKAKK